MLKGFIDFLLEWKIDTVHWSGERVSKTSPKSRIVPHSSNFPYGWICERLVEIDKSGKKLDKRMSLFKFLEASGLTNEEFETRVTETLHIYLLSKKVENKIFDIDTHRAVDLKRIAFQLGDQYWSPELKEITPGSGKTYVGSEIWAVVKDNAGVTVMWKDASDEQLKIEAARDRIKGDSSSASGSKRTLRFSEFSDEDYLRSFFKVDRSLYAADFFVVIPQTDSWKEDVKKQAETGVKYSSTAYQPDDPKVAAWKNLMKPDLQITFDNGSRLYTNEKIRTISDFKITGNSCSFLLLDDTGKLVGKRTVGPESTVSVIAPKEGNEREMGELPREGYLVKQFDVQRVFLAKDEKGKQKGQIKGALNSIYVVVPGENGAFVPRFSPLK